MDHDESQEVALQMIEGSTRVHSCPITENITERVPQQLSCPPINLAKSRLANNIPKEQSKAPVSQSVTVEEAFMNAAKLASSPQGAKWALSTEDKLRMYACYKQASIGPCFGNRPGVFDPVGRRKYDAWKAASSLGKEDAMKNYIAIVEPYTQS